jgi:hypothetical protein
MSQKNCFDTYSTVKKASIVGSILCSVIAAFLLYKLKSRGPYFMLLGVVFICGLLSISFLTKCDESFGAGYGFGSYGFGPGFGNAMGKAMSGFNTGFGNAMGNAMSGAISKNTVPTTYTGFTGIGIGSNLNSDNLAKLIAATKAQADATKGLIEAQNNINKEKLLGNSMICCPSGTENIDGKCYSTCPVGYVISGKKCKYNVDNVSADKPSSREEMIIGDDGKYKKSDKVYTCNMKADGDNYCFKEIPVVNHNISECSNGGFFSRGVYGDGSGYDDNGFKITGGGTISCFLNSKNSYLKLDKYIDRPSVPTVTCPGTAPSAQSPLLLDIPAQQECMKNNNCKWKSTSIPNYAGKYIEIYQANKTYPMCPPNGYLYSSSSGVVCVTCPQGTKINLSTNMCI